MQMYMYMYTVHVYVQYSTFWEFSQEAIIAHDLYTVYMYMAYASELFVALYLELKIAQDQLLDTKQELNQATTKSGTEDKRITSLTDDLNTLQDQLSLLTVAKDKYDAVSQDLEESVSLWLLYLQM